MLLICEIQKKKKELQMNLSIKQKYSYKCRKEIYVYQGMSWRRDKLGDWD